MNPEDELLPTIYVDGSPCYNLQEVADRVYGDATRWKEIAIANGIDHPANIPESLKNIVLPDIDQSQDTE